MRLQTERLLLRSLLPQDVEPELRLWADPDVTRFMGGPRDSDRVRQILEDELRTPPAGPLGQWPVVVKATGEFVGDCGLVAKDIDGRSEIELVYLFEKSAWGMGYATEIGSALLRFAHEELGRERIVSLIDSDNVASRRVAVRLGMSLEAVVTRPDGGQRELWVSKVCGA
jgi:RimJ/RimL family protein N-acetyltransferase